MSDSRMTQERQLAERVAEVLTATGQLRILHSRAEIGDAAALVITQRSTRASERLEPQHRLSQLLIEAAQHVLGTDVSAHLPAALPERGIGVDTFLFERSAEPSLPPRAAAVPTRAYPPSRRELEVLQSMADGHQRRDVAARLFISESTVKTHLNHLYTKLGATDRAHAIAIAMRAGLIR